MVDAIAISGVLRSFIVIVSDISMPNAIIKAKNLPIIKGYEFPDRPFGFFIRGGDNRLFPTGALCSGKSAHRPER